MPNETHQHQWGFYEFFAGGGMARLGFGKDWACQFSNEWCEKKAQSYRANFPDCKVLHVGDINKLTASDLPGRAELAWASFPCQDLSLAGNGEGLSGDRSGTFWAFWKLMTSLATEGRRPPIITLENVEGLLTSNGGADFTALCSTLAGAGLRFGLLQVDGVLFVPQSRPRVFIVAIDGSIDVPPALVCAHANPVWHSPTLESAVVRLPQELRSKWVWWNLAEPKKRRKTLADLIEEKPKGVEWHTQEETKRLLAMMSPINRRKVTEMQKLKKRIIGTVYKRTRHVNGVKTQRAEARFDDISGCLRTPAGGSSRQTILIVEGSKISSRLLSPREASRLMGLPDSYKLPDTYNEAYHLCGDGLVVSAVSHLAKFLLAPLAAGIRGRVVPLVAFHSEATG